MIAKPALSVALAILLAGLMPPGARADAANGERLARQWCANCHVVDGGGGAATLPQGPPSFRTAAGRLNPDELRTWLTHPHGAMPDLGLTRAEIADLIDYIGTLR
ncbi:MAG TPA: cytochrome c [Stellaceae bacterium]|nr:cytochrome c [Stellaceae bacterium]